MAGFGNGPACYVLLGWNHAFTVTVTLLTLLSLWFFPVQKELAGCTRTAAISFLV